MLAQGMQKFPDAVTLLDAYALPDELRTPLHAGLAAQLRALEEETELNEAGRARALGGIHDDLSRLAAIMADRVRYPAISDVEITRPMFILGLPRCGTSLLHALIGADPQIRTPLMWEVAFPSPPPEGPSFETDARIGKFDDYVQRHFGGEISEVMKAHPIGAKIPQECGAFMITSLRSSNPVMLNRIPGFYQWFLGADAGFRYQIHKCWLQHLAWRNPRLHWVLKIQEHMYHLPALRAVYPDAIFVQPHRDPTTVIASISELIHTIRAPAFDKQDRAALGQEMLHLWHDGQVRMMDYRKAHPDLPIHDLRYRDLVADPVACVRRIYARFGWDFKDESQAGILAWLAENPAGKHGKHDYRLADFDLTEADVRRVYADYVLMYADYL